MAGATMAPTGAILDDRQLLAARLGSERRRLFLVGLVISMLAPLLPYLSGSWETVWYALATTDWPIGLRGALFLVGFHVALAVVMLPLSYYGGLAVPRAFGLSRQGGAAWLLDWAKATVLATLLGGGVGGVFLWTVSYLGSSWCGALALMCSAGYLLLVFVTPYVIPLFFKMAPIEDAALTLRMRDLARRAGTEIRDVCTLDFSRRTAEANAAVVGFGRSRRMVLADTLLAQFEPAGVDAVVAHELGHHAEGHVRGLLLGQLVLIWVGLGLAAWLAPAALPLLSVPWLGYVPGYPELFVVAELYFLLASPLTNWWSRRFEAAADRFALRVVGNPSAFAGAMRRLAAQNLVELWPPRWSELLLGTHPALGRRIARAESLDA